MDAKVLLRKINIVIQAKSNRIHRYCVENMIYLIYLFHKPISAKKGHTQIILTRTSLANNYP